MDPVTLMILGPMVTACVIVGFALVLVRRERAHERKKSHS